MLTKPEIVELALAYAPYLLFDPTERFYPVAAEEWLNHRATEPWSSAAAERRGSAVMRVERNATDFTDGDVQAGSHFPLGDHLALSPNPPHGIAQSFGVNPQLQDLFLNVGGWEDVEVTAAPTDPRLTTGSSEYLDLLFRTVSSALNPTIPADEPPEPPAFTVPRMKAPTIYAEVEWAGLFPRLDKERVDRAGGRQDFPQTIRQNVIPPADNLLRDLDNYLAVTYYLLYPVMEPPPGSQGQDLKRREGQWEAITVFLRGHPPFSSPLVSGRAGTAGSAPISSPSAARRPRSSSSPASLPTARATPADRIRTRRFRPR